MGNTSTATINVASSGSSSGGTTSGSLYETNEGANGYPSAAHPVLCLSTTGNTTYWHSGAQYNGGTYWYIGDGVSAMGIAVGNTPSSSCGANCIRWVTSGNSNYWVNNRDGRICNVGVFWTSN